MQIQVDNFLNSLKSSYKESNAKVEYDIPTLLKETILI
jgi:hypothetical protein